MRGLGAGSPISINNLPSIAHLSTHCIAVTLIGIEPDNDSVSYHHQAFIKQWLQQTAQLIQRRATNTVYRSIPDHGFDIARDTGVWVSATLLEATIPYRSYPSSLSFASSTYHGLTQARTGDTVIPYHKIIKQHQFAGSMSAKGNHYGIALRLAATQGSTSLTVKLGSKRAWVINR